MLAQVEPDARVLGSKIKRDDWTFEQDMVFEHAMAEFEETVSMPSPSPFHRQHYIEP